MNLQTGKTVEVQFNPHEFTRSVAVNWKHFTVPGLSHEPMHYIQTKNDKFGFKVTFIAHPDKGKKERDIIHEKLRFFQSLCYPKRGATNITDAGPPRVLVVWPNFLSMTCVIIKLKEHYKRFNQDGVPIIIELDLEVQSIRDVRLTSDQVLQQGLKRDSGSTATSRGNAGNSSGSNPTPPTTGGNI
jgi:hypothetical protein